MRANPRWGTPEHREVDGKKSWVIGTADGGHLVKATRWGWRAMRFTSRQAAIRYLRTPFPGSHPTQRLRCGRRLVDIDQMLVPIIRATWALRLRTMNSCQSTTTFYVGQKLPGRWCLITLPVRDAEQWMIIVNPNNEHEAYTEKPDAEQRWNFATYFGNDHRFRIHIWFKWCERARVLANLRKAVRK